MPIALFEHFSSTVWFLVWPNSQYVIFFSISSESNQMTLQKQLSADIRCIRDAKQKGCDMKDAQIRSGGHKVRGVTFSHCISPFNDYQICKRFKSVWNLRFYNFKISFNWWRKDSSWEIPHIKWASGWREMQEEEEEEEEPFLFRLSPVCGK